MKARIFYILLLLTIYFVFPALAHAYFIVCGDINNDSTVNVGDPVFLINNIFKDGISPYPYMRGDVNCDSAVDVGDCVYLISSIFKNGAPPCCLPIDYPPTTFIASDNTLINALDSLSPAPGIEFIIQAVDTIAGGGADRPLEYSWRLYGPFDPSATFNYIEVPEDCRYNPQTGQIECNTVYNVLDTTTLPPLAFDFPQPIRRSRGPDFDVDSSDVWVNDSAITVYDIYGDMEMTETFTYKFVIVASARDDHLYADTTPAQKEIYVVDPHFENGLMVLDETRFGITGGRYGAGWLDTTKAIMYNYLHGSGYDYFDTSNADMESDYFFIAYKKDYFGGTTSPNTPLTNEVFSHSLVIFITEDAGDGPDESSFGILRHALALHELGVPVLMMAMNIGNVGNNAYYYDLLFKSEEFYDNFGPITIRAEAWFADLVRRQIRNEQFIGATPIFDSVPDLDVDMQLLSTRYPYIEALLDTLPIAAVPEVGIDEAIAYGAEPIYVYNSMHGDSSLMQGQICGVRKDNNGRRAVALNFGPTAIDSTQMQAFFDYILPWLAESFDPAQYPHNKISDKIDRENRRDNLRHYLKQLSDTAKPDM